MKMMDMDGYWPRPVETGDVVLPAELDDLVEEMAKKPFKSIFLR